MKRIQALTLALALTLLTLLPMSQASSLKPARRAQGYAPGEIIIKLKAGVAGTEADGGQDRLMAYARSLGEREFGLKTRSIEPIAVRTANERVSEIITARGLDRIFVLKRDVAQLRRICIPQREIIHRLSRGEFSVISPKAAVYFRDIYDNLYRIVEASYAYQDVVQGTMDAYLSQVNNRLNETMKRLTVIGAIMASLTVITGVYGMNFEHMPELKWRFGYPLVLLVIAAVCVLLFRRFRRAGWL